MEEEMMMVMMKMKTRSHEQPSSIDHNPNHHHLKIPIISTTTSPVWKLYENPFYIFQNHNQTKNQEQEEEQESTTTDNQEKQIIHRLHLPIPARKIAASFWDLTFMKPFMESDLESARAELESERNARKKLESLNKKLAKEASEERRGREALERVCEELAIEISAHKSEITRMRREMEDERKMLRTAEVIREERVQMKLSEAKILMEEKISEMETTSKKAKQSQERSFLGEKLRLVLGEKNEGGGEGPPMAALVKRKSGGETENPHIRRGIKGFVEFPKVVREIGCRSSKHLGKLECQKAQLKILLKHKGALRFNGLLAR